MQQKRLIAVHLLNDFSGSPSVLKQVLAVADGHEIHLFTATPAQKGILTNLPGVNFHNIFYKWSPYKLLTLFFYLLSQFGLMVRLLFFLKRTDLVYINTLLPFGAALAARIHGCRVIYHVHEVSIRPLLLKKSLEKIARSLACRLVFVSEYLQKHFVYKPGQAQVIYNVLPENFTGRDAHPFYSNNTEKKRFTVLMACSLKKYKGVCQFITVATQMPALQFILVLNASFSQVQDFCREVEVPYNCEILPAQTDMIPFYSRADVVVNLSLPSQWIETFGLTILEGMCYGLPAIIPPVGGITELVCDGKEGFWINAENDIAGIVICLHELCCDSFLYQRMSDAARKKSELFSRNTFNAEVRKLLNEVPS